jgi:uncharacterized membrane protein YbaN (DUF454 family)
VYALLGFICLGLGIVGYLTPGWPGTVFLLMATWFFSRSSERMYRWILNNPRFGPLIRDYRAGYGIPRRIKVIAITLMLLSVGVSVVFAVENGWVRGLLVALATYGTWFILTRPTTEDVLAQA